MNPRALIAEDEELLAAKLVHCLRRLWPELEIAAISPDGVDAVEQALALRPDILFLDIKMPGLSGLEAAEELADRWDGVRPFPQVVFVTAYDDYAVNAFEQAAADYVLKPVNEARLGKTIERLRQRLALSGPADGLAQLVQQMHALPVPAPAPVSKPLTRIRAACGNQVRMIPVEQVAYFQSVDRYVNVVTREEESLIRLSLKELMSQLDPDRFCQIHRGTIVNMDCVASAVRDEFGRLMLTLHTRPEQLRVSMMYVHLFRAM